MFISFIFNDLAWSANTQKKLLTMTTVIILRVLIEGQLGGTPIRDLRKGLGAVFS